jgi:hypothetical protein
MEKTAYEAPVAIELGSFDEQTGQIGDRNGDEIVWFFDWYA